MKEDQPTHCELAPIRDLFPNMRPAGMKSNTVACTIVVDAEEGFDWGTPLSGAVYTTSNMRQIHMLQQLASAYGIAPAYMLTYPILIVPEIVANLRRYTERGECEVGVQLHPWVNPPFEHAGPSNSSSFAGNLAAGLERAKFLELIRNFAKCFGGVPQMYRAGRYGFGKNTASLLEQFGFAIDISLAPRTTFVPEGGPDFTGYGCQPFWFGRSGLLEIPLCREIVGWSSSLAPHIYKTLSTSPSTRLRLQSLAARLRCAERITLSPEGNDLSAMIRLVDSLHGAGQRLFVVSFHSSSLSIGQNPYVRSKAELHHFYDRLSGILDYVSRAYKTQFTRLSQMPSYLQASE